MDPLWELEVRRLAAIRHLRLGKTLLQAALLAHKSCDRLDTVRRHTQLNLEPGLTEYLSSYELVAGLGLRLSWGRIKGRVPPGGMQVCYTSVGMKGGFESASASFSKLKLIQLSCVVQTILFTTWSRYRKEGLSQHKTCHMNVLETTSLIIV